MIILIICLFQKIYFVTQCNVRALRADDIIFKPVHEMGRMKFLLEIKLGWIFNEMGRIPSNNRPFFQALIYKIIL